MFGVCWEGLDAYRVDTVRMGVPLAYWFLLAKPLHFRKLIPNVVSVALDWCAISILDALSDFGVQHCSIVGQTSQTPKKGNQLKKESNTHCDFPGSLLVCHTL